MVNGSYVIRDVVKEYGVVTGVKVEKLLADMTNSHSKLIEMIRWLKQE
jgi:hypothetical protein